MKSENILADIKSKSLKEAKEEISQILSKLENKDINLEESIKDYERLIKLNNHINELFRIKVKKISSVKKK
ncbi:exodeoxyribonuclease VII small subunit [Pelagibacteraceae bacterium]|nr:exodeoxyribonuclease VII small subunit [Pelagibacteraceae bacterium]|tara:strand:+ start:254 stop:466 length:213 start_codon:yes stop_codon:yes gene_type:complete